MNRWSYSVNIAMWEPFTELEQLMGYYVTNLDTCPGAGDNGICDMFRGWYCPDCGLLDTLDSWFNEIIPFLRDTLGDKHLVTTSLGLTRNMDWMNNNPDVISCDTSSSPCSDTFCPTGDYYAVFSNPNIDIVDLHTYEITKDMNKRRQERLVNFFDTAYSGKPYHMGECSTYGSYYYDSTASSWRTLPPLPHGEYRSSQLYHNYDASFHNEIWSSAFTGSFTTGMSWQWEIIHWWPDGMATPEDPVRLADFHTNEIDFYNKIYIGDTLPDSVQNRKYSYGYKPLADFIGNIASLYFDFPSTPGKYYNYNATTDAGVEAYYLTGGGLGAVGWVHNLNKYWYNEYYFGNPADPNNQGQFLHFDNYYGCINSNIPASHFEVSDLQPSQQYEVVFFPTRMGSYSLPSTYYGWSSTNGVLGITVDFDCDTINSDYAFRVEQIPLRLARTEETEEDSSSVSKPIFLVFPNPASNELLLHFPEKSQEVISVKLLDPTGKEIYSSTFLNSSDPLIDVSKLAKGIYYIRAMRNSEQSTKRISIH